MNRAILSAILFFWLLATSIAGRNFTGDPDVVSKAEASRTTLWRYWFGGTVRTWPKPCPITVWKAASASGLTTFRFDRGGVFGLRMNVAGASRSEIIGTAIPHEVNHTVFATRFRRSLPRWLDEGASIFVESESEHLRSRMGLKRNIAAKRFTRFHDLFKDSGSYPRNGIRLANVYNEGFAIVEFLINHHEGGKTTFIEFVGDVHVDIDGRSTMTALRTHYGYKSADAFESAWWNHWRTRSGLRCSYHACKAPHGAIFDPAFLLTDGRGTGIGIRSPIVGFAPVGRPAVPECRVVMFTGATCGPCIKWKREELPKVRAAGIFVEFVKNAREFNRRKVKSVPTFLIVHKRAERGRLVGFTSAAKLIQLFQRLNPATTSTTAPKNQGWETVKRPDCSAKIADLAESTRNLLTRMETIEGKPGVDFRELSKRLAAVENRPRLADLSGVDRRLSNLEGLVIPVRIETSEGKLIREKRYSLTRDEDGRLVFNPIVLKFDERILAGGK